MASTLSAATAALLMIVSFGLASSLPVFYGGCAIPSGPLGNHGAPAPDDAIKFKVTDANGSEVGMEFEPGSQYTIEVEPSGPSRGIITTTGGVFSGSTSW
mmetsp:Transcript_20724/g.57529  ORF Transcript_20724/g.57529 Transcript_20724/m.57529 type:complete len:100 (-) Transcript_20724:658-957(-)